MKKSFLSLSLLLVASNSYALFGEKELSKEEDILEVGECVKDDLESGKKSRKKITHWMVINHNTGALTVEYPAHAADTIRIDSTGHITYQEVSTQEEYFRISYRLKLKKHVTRETAERSWIFWTDDSTKKKTAKTEFQVLSYFAEKIASGDRNKQILQQKTADYEAKINCEQNRNLMLDKMGVTHNPAVSDSSRSVIKDVPSKATTIKKPAKASKQ